VFLKGQTNTGEFQLGTVATDTCRGILFASIACACVACTCTSMRSAFSPPFSISPCHPWLCSCRHCCWYEQQRPDWLDWGMEELVIRYPSLPRRVSRVSRVCTVICRLPVNIFQYCSRFATSRVHISRANRRNVDRHKRKSHQAHSTLSPQSFGTTHKSFRIEVVIRCTTYPCC
jgi:hypothetical protein